MGDPTTPPGEKDHASGLNQYDNVTYVKANGQLSGMISKEWDKMAATPEKMDNGDIYDKAMDDNDGDTTSSGSSTEVVDSNNCVYAIQNATKTCTTNHRKAIINGVLFVMFIGYSIYFGFAIAYDAQLAQSLIIMTAIVVFCIFYSLISKYFGDTIYNNVIEPCITPIEKRWHVIQWLVLNCMI